MKIKRAIVASLLITFMLAGCNSQAPEEVVEEKTTPVEVKQISLEEIKNELVYPGKTEAFETFSASGTGKVENTYFEVGDSVNANDTLLTLDEQDIRDQIKTLQSQLAIADESIKSAQTSYNTVTGGQYESQILQLTNAVDNAKKQITNAEIAIENSKIAYRNAEDALQNATKNFENIKVLQQVGSASQSDYDNAELSYNQALSGFEQSSNAKIQAENGYEQALAALRLAEETLELTQGAIVSENIERASLGISQSQVSKQSTQVQLENATRRLSDTSIKTNISGYISQKTAVEGEYISAQVPAYTIVNIDNIKISVRVSELLINRIDVGQDVAVFIRTISEEAFTGKIKTISPAADVSSTYAVEIELGNANKEIKPGMFAEVRFILEENKNTIVLPRNTILETEDREPFVYVNDNGVAKRVMVTTGIDNGKDIEITSGLDENSIVVVKGQSYLADGDKLNVIADEVN